MIPNDRLMQITERFEFLEAQMGEGLGGEAFVAVSREYAELRPVVEVVRTYQGLTLEIEGVA
jgi:peptide chain release factor 1